MLVGLLHPGLTLDELSGVAAAHTSRKVTVLRDLTPEQFLDHIRRSNDPSRRYVVNFRRKEIFDAGGGHFLPIAGYLEHLDLVFVLDGEAGWRLWLRGGKRPQFLETCIIRTVVSIVCLHQEGIHLPSTRVG